MKVRSVTRRQYVKCIAAVAVSARAVASLLPSRKTRAESYFGVHFDLHPNEQDMLLGRDVSEAMISRFLTRVRPDFVQYDCKGHPGWMGYPSQVQKSAKMVRDSLAVWRKVTAERGVSLYIHFSGVWDYLAAEQHPDWAVLHADGKPDTKAMSTFGPYEDQLMIPELLEAAQTHGLDGAWVDGDCWGVSADYRSECIAEFTRKSGITAVPRQPQDPGWQQFLEVNRESFRRYVRKYVDALHRKKAKFQIASNWLYSTYVPEKPEIPVDFLSGDYLGNAPISTARLQARYLAATGKTWDLMAWGFQSGRNTKIGAIYKSAEQLQQEACVTLAQGGAFQVYYQPTRAGYIDEQHVQTIGKVADFVRLRQTVCHGSAAVPQVAVIYSGHSIYARAKRPFGGWGEAEDCVRGVIDALVENQYSVDVIPDWKLDEAARYPLVVIPEWPDLGEDVRRRLVAVAERGSALIVIGAKNASLFHRALGVRLIGDPQRQTALIPGEEEFANVTGMWQDLQTADAQVIANRFPTYDATQDAKIAATIRPLGRGKIAGICGDVGTVFANTHAPEVRHSIGNIAAQLFQPRFQVKSPPAIEVALRAKEGKTYLHLINCAGMQVAGDYAVIDSIPAIGPIRIEGARKATGVVEAQSVRKEADGAFVLPFVAFHTVLEVE